MPSALEQATSSSSDIPARWNSLSGNLTLRLWTWRSHDGAPAGPLAADVADGAEDLIRLCVVCAICGLGVGGFGVVRLGLRTPARWPGRRGLPFTMALASLAWWSRVA